MCERDKRGNVVMYRARIKNSFMYACVAIAYVDKKPWDMQRS